MEAYINQENGRTYTVPAPYHGESVTLFYVVDEAGDPVASYREKWRAVNRAITGCGCIAGWHYYHGSKHE